MTPGFFGRLRLFGGEHDGLLLPDNAVASDQSYKIVFAVGLPYVMAAVMTYRPKILPTEDPRTQLGFNFERVEFSTSDGIKIVGWWIPAAPIFRWDSVRSRTSSPFPSISSLASQLRLS